MRRPAVLRGNAQMVTAAILAGARCQMQIDQIVSVEQIAVACPMMMPTADDCPDID